MLTHAKIRQKKTSHLSKFYNMFSMLHDTIYALIHVLMLMLSFVIDAD